jgi:hypothetical protein
MVATFSFQKPVFVREHSGKQRGLSLRKVSEQRGLSLQQRGLSLQSASSQKSEQTFRPKTSATSKTDIRRGIFHFGDVLAVSVQQCLGLQGHRGR